MKKLILTVACMAVVQGLWADIEAGKAYRLVPATDNGKAVFVENSAFDNGKKVMLWTHTPAPAQQWYAERQGEKWVLRNVYTGKYLTIASTVAQQSDKATATSAQWTLEPIDASTNTYRVAQTIGRQLRYLGALTATDGTQLSLAAKKTGDDAAQQTWTFVEETPITTFTHALRDEMGERYLASFLQTVSGGKTFTKGGWGEPEILETMLDAYETTGQKQYLDAFTSVYNYFKKKVGTDWLHLVFEDAYKWYGHDFNDDVMWMIIAAARAYQLTGQKVYINDAKRAFDGIWQRAYNQWGMLRWAEQQGDKNGTNSCINGPAEVAACYIAMGLGDESYYEKARALYDNQRRYLFNAESGAVYDCFTWNAETNIPGGYSYWSSTYNQGTMLGAATLLYNHYGDNFYLQDAQKIVDYSLNHLCNSDGIINVCQTVEGDLCGFKGILMRYMRQYATRFNVPSIMTWMQRNALHAYSNRNSKGITSSAWLTKAAEDGTYGDKRYDNQSFGCSTAVSAAFNAFVPTSGIVKEAWQVFQAEDFDYAQGVYTDQIDGRTVVTNIKKGLYTCYRNVDFGSMPARQIQLTLSKITNKAVGGSVEVCLDSPSAKPIATINAPTTDSWATLTADIAPVAGRHDVYMRFKTKVTSSTSAFSFDSFKFLTTATPLMSDVTKNGGVLTLSPASDQAALAIDADPTTSASVAGHQLSLSYQSEVAVRPLQYSVSVGTEPSANDPKSWTLMASNDGETWIELDRQDAASFADRATTQRHTLNTDALYTRFRLNITANHGGKNTAVSDWQLVGALNTNLGFTAQGTEVCTADGLYKPTRYAVTAPATTGQQAPTGWTLQGSTDGKTWDDIDHRTHQSFACAAATAFYTASAQKGYSQFRLLTDGEGTAQSYTVFAQLVPTATFYPGIFSNGGTFTAASSTASLKAIADADPSTSVRIPLTNGQAQVVYESPWPFKVKSYALCAGSAQGEKQANPKSWKVEVSQDGSKWTALRTELNKVFTKRGMVVNNTLASGAEWKYIRLNITAVSKADADEVVIDDWQLNGQCLTADALNASGATTTALVPVDNANETGDKVADNNIDTKYCYNFFMGSWLNYDFDTPVVANLYSVSSANDNAGRDPKAWTLMGSDNGTDWVTLDQQTQQVFPDRKTTLFFAFNNKHAYAHYRLVMDGNNGDTMLQLSEWQLLYSDQIASGIGAVTDNVGQAQIGIVQCVANKQLMLSMPTNGTVAVYTPSGQLVMQQTIAAGPQQVALPSHARGIYIIKVCAGAQQQTAKIMVR